MSIINNNKKNALEYEKIETVLQEMMKSLKLTEGSVFIHVPKETKKEETKVSLDKQIFELSSEVSALKNTMNKYLKVEIREEAVRVFASKISKIEEIIETYAQHEDNSIRFWIFYDRGDRMEILEKVVDIECEFENIFNTMDFDYNILPISSKSNHIKAKSQLIHSRM